MENRCLYINEDKFEQVIIRTMVYVLQGRKTCRYDKQAKINHGLKS